MNDICNEKLKRHYTFQELKESLCATDLRNFNLYIKVERLVSSTDRSLWNIYKTCISLVNELVNIVIINILGLRLGL